METKNKKIIDSLVYILLALILVFSIFKFSSVRNDHLETQEKELVILISSNSVQCPEFSFTTDCVEYEFEDQGEIHSFTYLSGSSPHARPEVNDNVMVSLMEDHEGNAFYQYQGYDRSSGYLITIIIFLAVVIIVARSTGARSFLSLLISILMIINIIIPALREGRDPYLTVIIGGFVLISILVYISQGFNLITHSSVIGSAISLLISLPLAIFLAGILKISGTGDEYSAMLSISTSDVINIRNITIASFILAGIAVLDDSSISQASIVSELMEHVSSKQEIFRSAMRVGIRHVGSMINTLFLAYVASSLPMVILIVMNQPDLFTVMNSEFVAEEFVRIVIGSIAIVISIPITTFITMNLPKLISGKNVNRTNKFINYNK